jgi:hypothetical protein
VAARTTTQVKSLLRRILEPALAKRITLRDLSGDEWLTDEMQEHLYKNWTAMMEAKKKKDEEKKGRDDRTYQP